ncbi:YkuS family protein [Bacillus sp. Bva_UNVM-123]|uniref:YkuS family protein n=1 Tax=Bacillus sp. Bva_UNVM-123 TaxID=2829798 RepID=UPI00391F57C7
MAKKVAVEQSLSNVSEALRDKGFEVIDIKSSADVETTNCSAYVVSGLDSNIMGIQEVSTNAPIIEASGMSADEVCQEVEQRLQY